MGKKYASFDLPDMNVQVDVQPILFREVQEELGVCVPEEHLHARNSLNADQLAAYNIIMMHVQEGRHTVFFIDGHGGTGKTFLYKALLAVIRARGHVALTHQHESGNKSLIFRIFVASR